MNKFLILSVVLMLALIAGCGSDTSQTKTKLIPYDFSYESYTELLADNVENGLVDYTNIKNNVATLDSLVDALSSADLATTTAEQRLAFYINAYNMLTIKSIVEAYPVGSIKDIDGVWDTKKWTVAGAQITLNGIEHEVLRKQFSEPRIHVAINCASIGCPPILEAPFYPDRLDSLLTVASQRFADSKTHNDIDAKSEAVKLSAIFDWFGDDFIEKYYDAARFPSLDKKAGTALIFVIDHMTVQDNVQINKTIADIEYLDYDWSLNDKKK